MVFRGSARRGEMRQVLAWLFAASTMFVASLLVEPPTAIALLLTFAALYVVGWVADSSNRSVLRDAESELRQDLQSAEAGLHSALADSVLAVRAQIEQSEQSLGDQLKTLDAEIGRREELSRKKDLAETYGVASSVAYLASAIGTQRPLQFTRDWSATPEMLAYLYELITTERPKVVLDIGSGMTTLVCALAASKSPGTRVVSWEHSPQYLSHTRELLEKHGVADRVELELRQLEPVIVDGQEYLWYAGPHGLGASIDVLIVDGPPGDTGPWARYPALPVFHESLGQDAVIVLDDLGREDEEAILERWQMLHTHYVSTLHGSAAKSVFATLRAPQATSAPGGSGGV